MQSRGLGASMEPIADEKAADGGLVEKPLNGPQRADTDATLVPYSSNSTEYEPLKSASKVVPLKSIDGAIEEQSLATSSTYHIFYRKPEKQHYIISPLDCPSRDRFFRAPHCCFKKSKIKKKEKVDFDVFDSDVPKDAAENSYFVHQPCISFHSPPRTLRHGPSKTSPTVAIINNSWFWRKWKLQLGSRLADEGVIDPRGVVSLKYDSRKNPNKDFRVKGYRVRSWRMWGESGKTYHREVNAQRKAKQDKTVVTEKELSIGEVQDIKLHDSEVIIDEVVHFSWNSPFTLKTRQYHFTYHGIDFYWKGTGTVKEHRTCGFFLTFNHLKLVARVPLDLELTQTSSKRGLWRINSAPAGFREICLGKYICSIGSRKAGTLQLYDDAIYRFLQENFIPNDATEKVEVGSDVVSVKHTRLYDIIVATAMCMIIGEWQKRKTIRKILEAAASEGGGSAG